MEFKNGYKLIYEKNKKLYATKANIPQETDKEIDLGLSQEQLDSIKLVYEKEQTIVGSTTNLPSSNPLQIQVKIDGQDVIGPSDKPSHGLTFSTAGITFAELSTLYPDYMDRFFSTHGDGCLPCFRFTDIKSRNNTTASEIRYAYGDRYAEDYNVGEIISVDYLKECGLWLVDSQDGFVGLCESVDGKRPPEDGEDLPDSIVTLYEIEITYDLYESIEAIKILDKATAPLHAYLGVDAFRDDSITEKDELLLKDTFGNILQTITYADLHQDRDDPYSEPYSNYFKNCKLGQNYILSGRSEDSKRLLWSIQDLDGAGNVADRPIKPEEINHKGLEAAFIYNDFVTLLKQDRLTLNVCGRAVENNGQLPTSLKGTIILNISKEEKFKSCKFSLTNNFNETYELEASLNYSNIYDDDDETVIDTMYWFEADYDLYDADFTVGYTTITVTFALTDPLTTTYHKDYSSEVDFNLWTQNDSGMTVLVEDGTILYSSQDYTVAGSDPWWWEQASSGEVTIYANNKPIATGEYSYGYWLAITEDMIEDGVTVIKCSK